MSTPQERGLQNDLNVIIFSDHGMTDIFWMDKVIELSKYISRDDLQQVKDRGPVVSLWPAPGKHSEARHTWWRGGDVDPSVPCLCFVIPPRVFLTNCATGLGAQTLESAVIHLPSDLSKGHSFSVFFVLYNSIYLS